MTVLFVLLITAAAVACIARGECGAGPCNNPQRRSPWSTLVVGLLIVLIGTVLLLDRMGVMDASRVFRFWPVLLIIFGLVGVFRADEPGKLVARGLIGLAGVLLLLMELQVVHFGFHEVWPVFIIVAGLLLVWAALRPPPYHIGSTTQADTSSAHLNVTSIFADGNWTVTAPDFENGYVRAVFGGFKIDLTQADMTASRAYMNLDVVFAGGEIRVPNAWNVLIEAHPVFGTCEDKTRRVQGPGPTKTLVLRGKVVFGSIELRN